MTGERIDEDGGIVAYCQWIAVKHDWLRDEYTWWVQCKGDNYFDFHDPRSFSYCPYCGSTMKEPLEQAAIDAKP